MSEADLRELAKRCLDPCEVFTDTTDFGRLFGLGWKHPNGGSHALRVLNNESARFALSFTVRERKRELVMRAKWAGTNPTRWQRWTMVFRPKQQKLLRQREAEFADARRLDREQR